jgi:F0F1-type ATP synthase membrane subunit a
MNDNFISKEFNKTYMKKFLLIPVLIFVYIFIVNNLSAISIQTENPTSNISNPGGITIIGFGESISVSVTRPYLFGLIRLPTYTSTLGNIGIYHDIFFSFIFILTAILIILEIKNRKEIKVRKTKIKRR